MAAITDALFTKYRAVLPNQKMILLPIVRAGIAMWPIASSHLAAPETEFVLAKKKKGTSDVEVFWPNSKMVDAIHAVIVDPIIATGDTILAIHASLPSRRRLRSVTVVACYAAPEAVLRILEEVRGATVIVGVLADRTLNNGMLFPITHGDMGDKLFRVTERKPR